MNIAFVNYYDFSSNSAIHIFYLANALCSAGHDCVVFVPDRKDTIEIIGEPHFRYMTFEEACSAGLVFRDGRDPDIIHAWTPREIVREFTQRLVTSYHCPYVVHLEDNEERIASDTYKKPWSYLVNLPLADLDRIAFTGVIHPIRYRSFLKQAAGISLVIDRLAEFAPPGLPIAEIWPGFAPAFLDLPPAPPELRASLGIAADEYVVVYPGNVHASNRNDVISLYLAVTFLNRKGLHVKLVRTGKEISDQPPDELREFVVDLGFLPKHGDVIRHIAMADALVQPGKNNAFNTYRLPAKLPEFFATGRPVVLPEANIGHRIRDGEQGILLHQGDSLELVHILERLLPNAEARFRIGRAGRDFAVENFNWARSAEHLILLYLKATEYWRKNCEPRPASVAAEKTEDPQPEPARRYRSPRRRFPKLSYATVADFCDSIDHFRDIAIRSGDLKDAQRPWMIKAILGQVPPGSRILEIGAGEPLVADVLCRLGYDVWVVDPYDGSGNGPVDYELFKERYPKIRFLRHNFGAPDDRLPKQGFEAVYSISVLEHVPQMQLNGLFDGVRFCLRPDGYTIHAIDHVLRGNGAESHLESLLCIANQCGISAQDLQRQVDAAAVDTETYFLSAEGHNRWRGTLPYHEFPMRVCISVQICVPRTDLEMGPSVREPLPNSTVPLAFSGIRADSAHV